MRETLRQSCYSYNIYLHCKRKVTVMIPHVRSAVVGVLNGALNYLSIKTCVNIANAIMQEFCQIM